jgi:UDP-GlcNAc:undecaprenyl-phosphate GlcNAc-1-phosphate transferase
MQIFNNWHYFSIFLVSLSISTVIVPFLKRLAIRFSVVDIPNQRHKTHKEPVPYLGGLAIVVPTLALVSFGLAILPLDNETKLRGMLLIIPGLALSLVGLLDDKENLRASTRFVFQVCISGIISIVLIQNDISVKLFQSDLINFCLSVFWIVGITNAFNFLDNLDGAAAGTTILSSGAIFVLALLEEQFLIATFSLTICAAALGFLYWNRSPASIYLGDGGALFIGLVLSVLLLQFEPNVSDRLSASIIPVLIMAVPIIDTSVAVISRISRRVSIFQGGRDHLSHRLTGLGLSKKLTAMCIWIIATFYSLLSLAIYCFEFMQSPIYSILSLLLILLTIVFFLRIPIT